MTKSTWTKIKEIYLFIYFFDQIHFWTVKSIVSELSGSTAMQWVIMDWEKIM